MTNTILLLLILGCSLVTAGISLSLYLRVIRREEAPREPAREEAPERETRQGPSMDESFENLMRYQVKLGRGETTGGEA